jgi:hypothetical protein
MIKKTVSQEKRERVDQMRENLKFRLFNFFEINHRGDIYYTLKSLIWATMHFRSRNGTPIARTFSGRFAGCHVDTVTDNVARLEAAGFVKVGRAFKQVNTFIIDQLEVFKEFFGYSVNWSYLKQTTLLTNYFNLIYLNSKYVDSLRIEKFFKNLPEKVRILVKESLNSYNRLPGLRTRTPVLRPCGDTVYISQSEQCSSINTAALFPDYEALERNREIRDAKYAAFLADQLAIKMADEARAKLPQRGPSRNLLAMLGLL